MPAGNRSYAEAVGRRDEPDATDATDATDGRAAAVPWSLALGLAALAGILLTPVVGLDYYALTLLVINAYAAAMLGRLKSLPLTFAGADITEFSKPPVPPSLQGAQDAMENCTKPVVAAVHGTALGGGLEVAMCAHFRVSAPSAKFGLPEVKRGLFAAGGGTALGRKIPIAFAMELLLTGDTIDAQRAREIGLINVVVEPDQVQIQGVVVGVLRKY